MGTTLVKDIARRGKKRKSVAGEYVLKSPMLKYSEKKVGKDIRTFFSKSIVPEPCVSAEKKDIVVID